MRVPACPRCAESIQPAAIVCPHCRHRLAPRDTRTLALIVVAVFGLIGLATIVAIVIAVEFFWLPWMLR